MNALTRWENRWNPFKEMEELTHQLSSLLCWSAGRLPAQGKGGPAAVTLAAWAPLVDITEDDREYVIKAELPEVTKKDLKVTVENGVLTISGERKLESEEKDRRYHRMERAYGSFVRSFTLPDETEPSRVNAEFKDGVLTVRVAKGESSQPKAIAIKVA